MKATTPHGRLTAVILCSCMGATLLAQSAGTSDSERLRELEGIVQQLREQNQSLQQRVGELEPDRSRAPGEGIYDQSSVANHQSGAIPAGKPSAGLGQLLKSSPELDQPLGQQSPVIERVRQAAQAARKIGVVEVLGEHAGWLALQAGTAVCADAVLIPEIPYDLHDDVRIIIVIIAVIPGVVEAHAVTDAATDAAISIGGAACPGWRWTTGSSRSRMLSSMPWWPRQ